jgi:predicted RNA-binding protein with PUA-like domain
MSLAQFLAWRAPAKGAALERAQAGRRWRKAPQPRTPLVARRRRHGVSSHARSASPMSLRHARSARSAERPLRAAAQTGVRAWLLAVQDRSRAFSWDQQKSRGAKGEPWSGVRNCQAAKNMKAMKKGDLGFFYHTVDEKRIVGIVEVIGEYRKDPDRRNRALRARRRESGEGCAAAVTLAEIKGRPKLGYGLVKYSRLSVQPVTDAEWK